MLTHDCKLVVAGAASFVSRCPICKSIMQMTRTTKDCLHRFCSDCIDKSLRSVLSAVPPPGGGAHADLVRSITLCTLIDPHRACRYCKKECPTCRKECPSHRHTRDDENFDKLIAMVFPDRGILEEEERLRMEKIHQFNNTKAPAEIYQKGIKAQQSSLRKRQTPRTAELDDYSHAPSRPRGLAKRVRRSPSTSTTSTVAAVAPVATAVPQAAPPPPAVPSVELVFEAHPREAQSPDLIRLAHKYLTTTPDCTFAHLGKYLRIQYGEANPTGICRWHFYTEGYHGYTKWDPAKTLKTAMAQRMSDQIAKLHPTQPFTVYYARSNNLQ